MRILKEFLIKRQYKGCSQAILSERTIPFDFQVFTGTEELFSRKTIKETADNIPIMMHHLDLIRKVPKSKDQKGSSYYCTKETVKALEVLELPDFNKILTRKYSQEINSEKRLQDVFEVIETLILSLFDAEFRPKEKKISKSVNDVIELCMKYLGQPECSRLLSNTFIAVRSISNVLFPYVMYVRSLFNREPEFDLVKHWKIAQIENGEESHVITAFTLEFFHRLFYPVTSPKQL